MDKECLICKEKFKTIKYGTKRKYCFNCVPSTNDAAKQASEARRAIKRQLVNDLGGKCSKCGYSKSISALEFHHLDIKAKEFEISTNNISNYNLILEEIKKCILVCANCHREIHEKERTENL